MGEKDNGLGLGLSLSLGCGRTTQTSLKHNPSPSMQSHPHKTPWSEIFQLSGKYFSLLHFFLEQKKFCTFWSFMHASTSIIFVQQF